MAAPVGLLLSLWTGVALAAPPPAAIAALRPGDVVATGSGAFWSELAASFSETDTRFGHVGVIVEHEDGLMVLDAGAMTPEGHAGVSLRPLAGLIDAANHVAVYRLRADGAVHAGFLRAVTDAASRGLPFDDAFSLDTPDALYCTELLWRALGEALGGDPVPEKTRIAGRVVITVEDLLRAPALCRMAAWGPDGPLVPPPPGSLCPRTSQGDAR